MVNLITCSQLEKTFEGEGSKTYALKSTSLTFEKGDLSQLLGLLAFEGVDATKEFYFVYNNVVNTGSGYAIRFDN